MIMIVNVTVIIFLRYEDHINNIINDILIILCSYNVFEERLNKYIHVKEYIVLHSTLWVFPAILSSKFALLYKRTNVPKVVSKWSMSAIRDLYP